MVVGHEYADKNKMDYELKYFFKLNDRRIFSSEDEIKAFVADVKKVAHSHHPRCKEMPLYVEQDWDHKKDLIVRGEMGLKVDFFAFEASGQMGENFADKALEVFTENFMIHSVEELDAAEDADGVPYLTQIEVKYSFFGKIGEAQYVATKLDMGLAEAFVSLTMDNELMESLEDQIEEHEDGILVFLNAWVKAYNEGPPQWGS